MLHTVRWERDDRITLTFELSVGRNWLDLSHQSPRILLLAAADVSYQESAAPTNLWCWTIDTKGSSVLSKDGINVISFQCEEHPGITLLSAYTFQLAGVDGCFISCTNPPRRQAIEMDQEEESVKEVLVDSQETVAMGSLQQQPPSKLSQLSTQSMEASPLPEDLSSSLVTSQFAMASGMATQMDDDGSDTTTTGTTMNDAAEESLIAENENGSDTDETVDTNTAKDLVRSRRSRQKEEDALRKEVKKKSLHHQTEPLENKNTSPETPPEPKNEHENPSILAGLHNLHNLQRETQTSALFPALEGDEDESVKEPTGKIGDTVAFPIDLECDGDDNEITKNTDDLKPQSSQTITEKSGAIDASAEDDRTTVNNGGKTMPEDPSLLIVEATRTSLSKSGEDTEQSGERGDMITDKCFAVVTNIMLCEADAQVEENCDEVTLTKEPTNHDKLLVADTTVVLTEVSEEGEEPGEFEGHKPLHGTIAKDEEFKISDARFGDITLKQQLISGEAAKPNGQKFSEALNLPGDERKGSGSISSPGSGCSCVTQVADERFMQSDLEKAVVGTEENRRQNQDATELSANELHKANKSIEDDSDILKAEKTRRQTPLLLHQASETNEITQTKILPSVQVVGHMDTEQASMALNDPIASCGDTAIAETDNKEKKSKNSTRKKKACVEKSKQNLTRHRKGVPAILPGLAPEPITPLASKRQAALAPKTTNLDGNVTSELDFPEESPVKKRFTSCARVPASNSRTSRQHVDKSELALSKAADNAQDKRPASKRRASDSPRIQSSSRKTARTRAINTPSKKIAEVRILVTGVKLTDRQVKMVNDLGGEIVTDLVFAKNATHVIAADKASILRTPKLMIALCRTTNIVSLEWLKKSDKQKSWLPCDEFRILNDKEAERRYDFSMKETLDRLKQNLEAERCILDGWNVFICQGVAGNGAPTEEELKYIVEATGATWISSRRSLPSTRLLILTSDPETKEQVSKKAVASALEQGAIKRSIKWFFAVTFKQKTDLPEA